MVVLLMVFFLVYHMLNQKIEINKLIVIMAVIVVVVFLGFKFYADSTDKDLEFTKLHMQALNEANQPAIIEKKTNLENDPNEEIDLNCDGNYPDLDEKKNVKKEK